MTVAPVSPGTFTPDPGAAPLRRMLLAQTALEVRMVLRNGEQLLLTVVIPVLVLVVFGNVEVMDLGDPHRAGRLPRARRPGAGRHVDGVHRAGHRHGFRAAVRRAQAARCHRRCRAGRCSAPRASSVLTIEALQVLLLAVVAQAIGWDPRGSWLAVLVLVLAGTAAFAALALLMAGTLRAEATLAGANLVYLLFLVTGGIAVPLSKFPVLRPAAARGAARGRAVAGAAHRAPGRRRAALAPGRRPARSGPSSPAPSPRAPSSGSEPVQAPPTGRLPWSHARPVARLGPEPGSRAPGLRGRAGLQRRDRGHRRRGPADRLRAGLPDLPALHRLEPGADPRDGRARRRRVLQPDADLRAVRGGRRRGRRRVAGPPPRPAACCPPLSSAASSRRPCSAGSRS